MYFTMTLVFLSKFQIAKVSHFILDLVYIAKWTKFLTIARKPFSVLEEYLCDILELFIVGHVE